MTNFQRALFIHLKEKLGIFIIGANTKWVLFLKDFMNMIDGAKEDVKLEKEKERIELLYYSLFIQST